LVLPGLYRMAYRKPKDIVGNSEDVMAS